MYEKKTLFLSGYFDNFISFALQYGVECVSKQTKCVREKRGLNRFNAPGVNKNKEGNGENKKKEECGNRRELDCRSSVSVRRLSAINSHSASRAMYAEIQEAI